MQPKLLGKWTSTSLVVGNMVGAGVFMMPAVLAAYGGISIIGWLISSTGAILLAVLFSRLSKLLPGLQGGPYAYTRRGLGDFPAFLVAWGYWISVWTTNAALSVAFVSYLNVFLPVLADNIIYSVGMSLIVIWGLTWFNSLGVSKVGKLSLITTILKLAPIFIIGVWGLFYIDFSYFEPFNLSTESDFAAITATTTLTFFSFLGIESATIPAESVKNPEKTVAFATKWGTLIAAVVYILSSVAVLGLISPETLSNSTAPFADAALVLWGEGAQYFIAIAAVISVFGALNGWILIQGQMPQAIAHDKLFPKVFSIKNKNNVPALGMVISSALATLLIIMNYSGGLVEVFEFMILVSTVSVLIPYIFSSISFVIIKRQSATLINKNPLQYLPIVLFTLAFSVYALYGSGYDAVFWGVLFLLLGVPVYLFIKSKKSSMKSTHHSEFGQLKSIYIKPASESFINQNFIDGQWEELNYLGCPQFDAAISEYEQFEKLIKATGANVLHFTTDDTVKMDSIYCRDASIATDWGLIICNMGKAGRMNEPLAAKKLYDADGETILGVIEAPGTIEGGDVAWLDDKTLAIGRTYRTNDNGIAQMKALLEPKGIEIIIVDLPHYKGPSDVFHLMSILSPVDKDLAVVYSPLMPIKFREMLTDRGFELVEVPEEEFDSMGCNVLATSPRNCLMVAGNPITQQRLEAAGAKVTAYVGTEISVKGGGGPTCLTRPMLRTL